MNRVNLLKSVLLPKVLNGGKKITKNIESVNEKFEKTLGFEPLISFFVCKWCAYAAADLAGSSRLQYPPNVRIFTLPCSGKMDIVYALKAFEKGIDGVLVSGCPEAKCRNIDGNHKSKQIIQMVKNILKTIGIDPKRIEIHLIPARKSTKFVEIVEKFVEKIKYLGPIKTGR